MQKGDLVPHFTVMTVQGDTARYDTHWQRRNVVVLSTAGQPAETAAAALRQAVPDPAALTAACIITAEPIGGSTRPLLLVADQWGEIIEIDEADRVDDLPIPALGRVLEYLEIRCPECEGEAL